MIMETLSDYVNNQTKNDLNTQQKLSTQILEHSQHQEKQNFTTKSLQVEVQQHNGEKKKKKKCSKKPNHKNLLNKKLLKSEIQCSKKNLHRKESEKLKQKRIKTQVIVQKTANNISQNLMPVIHKNLKKSPSKKTIISDKNMFLRPFDQRAFTDESVCESIFFGSLDGYLNESQKMKKNVHKNICFWKDSQDFQINLKNSDQFLSNIIRKNNEEKPSQINNFSYSKSQIKLESVFKRQDTKVNNEKAVQNENIFHNEKLSSHLVKMPNFMFLKRKKESLDNKMNLEKSKIFRIKTQVIHTINNSSLQRSSSEQFKDELLEEKTQISTNFCPYQFAPTSNSSLGIYKSKNTNNPQSILLPSDVIHQCYQKLKSKSKKLLRYSLIKQPNISLMENKPKKSRNIENELTSLKNLVLSEENKLKLPLIANGRSLLQKNPVVEKSSALNSIYQYKQNPKLKQKTDMSKNGSEIFLKYSNHLHTENIKDKLRCYTEVDSIEKRLHTESFKKLIYSQSIKNISPTSSINDSTINSLPSSKIMQNFHQRYYKDNNPQKSSNSKISKVNMSQNFISQHSDSIDWQHKKKLIIKKLGIML